MCYLVLQQCLTLLKESTDDVTAVTINILPSPSLANPNRVKHSVKLVQRLQ
jgi:hypothetical protein